jgi:hypothetical protein
MDSDVGKGAVTSVPPPGHRPSGEGWSRSAERGPSRRPQSQRLEPLSRRLLGVVAVLSALLIAAVAYAWSGGGENSLNPIAEAAARTQNSPGARLAIRAVYTSPLLPAPVTARGAGVYNGHSGRSRAWLELQVPTTAASVRFDSVGDDRVVYMRSPLLSGKLPPGDRWMAIEPGLGHSPETTVAGNSDARGQLELLRAVGGGVETVGKQQVRGVETTRYRGHFDFRGYAAELRREGKSAAARQYERLAKTTRSGTLVEVWVDDSGDLVRQARIREQVPTVAGGPPVTMEMTIAYFDFGASPRISLPGSHESFDATLIGRAELGLLTADSVEVPRPAGSARPMSSRAFHATAMKVCRDVSGRLSRLRERAMPLEEELKNAVRVDGLEAHSTLDAFRRASLGYYEPAIRLGRNAFGRLARLAPPARIEPRYRRLMRLSWLELEINLAATRAAEVGEYKLGHDLSQRLHGLDRRTTRIAKRIGLDSCGSKGKSGLSA